MTNCPWKIGDADWRCDATHRIYSDILESFYFIEDEKPKVMHDNVHVQIEKTLTEIVTSLTDNFNRNLFYNVEPWFVYVGMKVIIPSFILCIYVFKRTSRLVVIAFGLV